MSFVQAGTPDAPTAARTSTVGNVPASPTVGNWLLWAVNGNVAYAGATPTGWTLLAQSSTSASATTTVFARQVTGTEPASYSTATGGSGKWVSWITEHTGVDGTLDVAMQANATTVPPAVTTATDGAEVIAYGRANTASGVTGNVWTSTTGTVRVYATDNISGAVNTSAGMQSQIKATAGSVSPTLSVSGTTTIHVRMTIVLRPATVSSNTLTIHGARSLTRSGAALLTQTSTLAVRDDRAPTRSAAALLSQASSLTAHGARALARAKAALLSQQATLTTHGLRVAPLAGQPRLTQTSALLVHGARALTRGGTAFVGQRASLALRNVHVATRARSAMVSQTSTLTTHGARSATRVGHPALAQVVALAVHDARAITRVGAAALAQLTTLVAHDLRALTRTGSARLRPTAGPAPAARTIRVSAEDRTVLVPLEDRTIRVAAEDRTIRIPAS